MSKKLEHMRLPFLEVKAGEKAGLKKGGIKGYGAAFSNVDLGRDVILQGAFAESLDKWRKRGQLPAMRYMHLDLEVIGDWHEMSEDKKGLQVAGEIWVDQGIPRAQQAHLMSVGTGPKGLSIGYYTLDSDYDKDGNRLLKVLDLEEVSVVSFPMNPEAVITAAKSTLFDAEGRLVDKRTLEGELRETLKLSSRQAKALIADGYAGLAGLQRDADTDVDLSGLFTIINNLPIQKG